MSNTNAVKSSSKPKGDGFIKAAGKFLNECYIETVKKSAWPSWPELKAFTFVVIFAIVIVSAWIGTLDWLVGRFVEMLSRNAR